MIQVALPRTDLTVSRLGFGTASLHHLHRVAQRLDLLEVAAECGFTHFDTARMYGEGQAERTLGAFMAGNRRRSFTVATKFGYPADAVGERMPAYMYAARVASAASRRLGLRAAPRKRALSGADAERSLAASLAALRTDWVDILFVHEPSPAELPALHELAEWLQRQKTDGRVRWLGLSGKASHCVQVAGAIPGLFDVLQVEDSLDSKQADAVTDAGWPLQLTFGYLRNAAAAPGNALAVVDAALKRNASGSVLVSTRRAERIQALSRLAGDGQE